MSFDVWLNRWKLPCRSTNFERRVARSFGLFPDKARLQHMAMPVFARKDDLGPAGHGFGELGYQPVAFDRERGAHDIRSVLHEQAKCSASQIRRFVVFGNVEADFGSPDDHLNRLVIAKLDELPAMFCMVAMLFFVTVPCFVPVLSFVIVPGMIFVFVGRNALIRNADSKRQTSGKKYRCKNI
ncbi:MAG: hypothetical protein VW881_00090 [Alphaproteobacteria bacterium]|jgi:hypothetical protein